MLPFAHLLVDPCEDDDQLEGNAGVESLRLETFPPERVHFLVAAAPLGKQVMGVIGVCGLEIHADLDGAVEPISR